MKNPWKTLRKEEKYDNPWINVTHREVINPNGGDGVYGIIHFKNRALGIVPLDEENHTWLVGQYRYALSAYSWEIPMGGGPLDEDTLAAAQRELCEETGLEAKQWDKILHLHTSNSVTDEEGYVFLARELTQHETAFDETEDLKIMRLPFEEALQKVLSGEITDAISVAGLLRVKLWLEQTT